VLPRRLAGVALAVAAATLTPLASLDATASGSRGGDLEGSTADRADYSNPVISTAVVRVPMVFPVVGGASYTDTFLACRSGCARKHLGQDLMSPKMRPLVATFTGVISSIKKESYVGEGNYITLTGDNGWSVNYIHVNNDTPGTDDGRGTAAYAFAPGLHRGQRVIQGQLVGWSGDSGNAESTGPHTHFELRKGGPWDGVVYNAKPSLDVAPRLSAPRPSGPHPEGTLLRATTGGYAWLLTNGYKRRIFDPELAMNGYSEAQVVRVSPAELDTYTRTHDMGVRDGVGIKAPDGTLWLVVAGARVPVPTMTAMNKLGVATTRVRTVDAATLLRIRVAPEGTELPGVLRNGAIVRMDGDNRWWLLDKGKRRHIPDPATAASWGFSSADVTVVPATTFDPPEETGEALPTAEKPAVLFPEGTKLRARDGAIIRQASSGAMWIVSNGLRRRITSLPAYKNFGYGAVPVRTVPTSSLLLLPEGEAWPV
jgi:hypothetical protein